MALYDFDGRAPVVAGESAAGCQQQTFVTTGFFRKAHGDQRVSFGLVYDWMYNTELGRLRQRSDVGTVARPDRILGERLQRRGRLGRQTRPLLGQRVTDRYRPSTIVRSASSTSSGTTSSAARAPTVGCGSAFPTTAGSIPTEGGSLGDWIIGANVQVPLSCRMALYANASYMHPSAAAGATAANETFWDVGMGVCWYFGGNARSHAINGKCWTP